MTKTYDEASEVASESGAVHVDGPDGVAVSFTPAAALKTASRLDTAAVDALMDGPQLGSPQSSIRKAGLYLADDGLVVVEHDGERTAIPFATYESAGYEPPLDQLPREAEMDRKP
jgi:hypothetical protein